jgi:hypothetical protein
MSVILKAFARYRPFEIAHVEIGQLFGPGLDRTYSIKKNLLAFYNRPQLAK